MSQRVQRIAIFGGVLFLAALLLIARLMYMQIYCYQEYSKQSQNNMVRLQPVLASRGVIFDRKGRVMARNVAHFTITMLPAEVENPIGILNRIASVIRMPKKHYQTLLRQMREQPNEKLIIKEPLDEASLARFAEVQSSVPGLKLDVKPLREYPLGEVASHVLGHVGEIDSEGLKEWRDRGYTLGEWVGKDGVEYSRERILHGQSGIQSLEVDVSGTVTRELVTKQGQPGRDIYLTIDAQLQSCAETSLQATLNALEASNGEACGGAVVAVEAQTGFVRAMVSLPDYNPNWFSSGISSKRFSRLINDRRAPLLNKAVCGACPPGSTFKLITTAACLQEGIISPYSGFYCSGVYYVNDLPFNCFVRSGHGPLDLIECIAQSCDVAYYQMGTKLGLARLSKYAHSFGMGTKTGIALPGETAGLFPYPGWKEKYFGQKWFAGDNANAAIGQGFVSASPIQVAMMTSAVANGGTLYRPQLIERISNTNDSTIDRIDSYNLEPIIIRQVPVKPAYLAAVRRGMAGTVDHGTAARYSQGIDMGGKTGTAENSPTIDNPHGRNHAWFTGFSPVDNPELVVTVFLEKSGGYGGELAAPVAFDVVREWELIKKSKLTQEVKPVHDRDQ